MNYHDSLHGPPPRWWSQDAADRAEELQADKYDEEPQERRARLMLEERRSCKLPYAQRTSEATRIGRCRMLGIDPHPTAGGEPLLPRAGAHIPGYSTRSGR
jgi:hypothetical protein